MKNPVLASLLGLLIIGILTVVVVPKMLAAADKATNLIQEQSTTVAYTGTGVITDYASSAAGCSIEIMGDSGLSTVTRPTCSGLSLGNTVKAVNGVVR